MSLVGKAVVVVKPVEGGPPLECDALVLNLEADQEGTLPRRAVTLVCCSPDASDVTVFGRAIRTLKSVPHEDHKDVGALTSGEYWREREGVA
jgi:hypothetical protein